MAEDSGGFQFNIGTGSTAGNILSAVNVGAGLVSGLLAKRDQKKVQEANRRRAAFSNLVQSFGVPHRPVFQEYSPGRLTNILSGLSTAAAGGVQAIDYHQRHQERERRREEDERRQALELGRGRGTKIARTSPTPSETPPTGIETPPQKSYEQLVEETVIPGNIKPEHHELYRRGALEATTAYDDRQRSIRSEQLRKAYDRENLRLNQMSINQRIKTYNAQQANLEAQKAKHDADVERWIKQIIDNPEAGMAFYQQVEPGLMSEVLDGLAAHAATIEVPEGEDPLTAYDFLKVNWTPKQEDKFEALRNWKQKLVLYEDMVRYLEKEGVLGVIEYNKTQGIDNEGNTWTWKAENLLEKLPTSEYAPTFKALAALRQDLVNAYHRAATAGVMTEGDYVREAPMIPDAEAFFVKSEIGEKFAVLHELHSASEATYLARLNISNVYTGNIAQDFAEAGMQASPEEISRLANVWGAMPIEQMPGEVTPGEVTPGSEEFTPGQLDPFKYEDFSGVQPRSTIPGTYSPTQIGPRQPSIVDTEPEFTPAGTGSLMQNLSARKLPKTESAQTAVTKPDSIPGVSNESLIPFTSEGMSEDALRTILHVSMEELGHRSEHIKTMQLDDIMRELATPKARELRMMGILGPNPFMNRANEWNDSVKNALDRLYRGSPPVTGARPGSTARGFQLQMAQ